MFTTTFHNNTTNSSAAAFHRLAAAHPPPVVSTGDMNSALINTKNAISVFETTQASSVDVAFQEIATSIAAHAIHLRNTLLLDPLIQMMDQHQLQMNKCLDQEASITRDLEKATVTFNADYNSLVSKLDALVIQLNQVSASNHIDANIGNEVKDLIATFDDQLNTSMQLASRIVDLHLDQLKQTK